MTQNLGVLCGATWRANILHGELANRSPESPNRSMGVSHVPGMVFDARPRTRGNRPQMPRRPSTMPIGTSSKPLWPREHLRLTLGSLPTPSPNIVGPPREGFLPLRSIVGPAWEAFVGTANVRGGVRKASRDGCAASRKRRTRLRRGCTKSYDINVLDIRRCVAWCNTRPAICHAFV